MIELKLSAIVQRTLTAMFLTFLVSSCASTNYNFEIENIPQGEAADMAEIIRMTPQLQDKRAPKQNNEVFRGVHPKSHGCVSADFIINEDISAKYQEGLFSNPGKKYLAIIRFSNASVAIGQDSELDTSGATTRWKHGSRGMAIKVYDVHGDFLDRDSGQKNQDFLMINTPEFAFATVRGYEYLTNALLASNFGFDPNKLIGIAGALAAAKGLPIPEPTQADFDVLKEGLRDALPFPQGFTLQDLNELRTTLNIILLKIHPQALRNPLHAQYFGASPFLFGENKVMKFSVAPRVSTAQAPFEVSPPESPSKHFLREALSMAMQEGQPVTYDFKILVREKSDDFGEDNLLIENASTTWAREGVSEIDQYVDVATLIITTPQNPASEASIVQCENLVFSPWHSLVAHKPIGGINRLRRSVYSFSAIHRKQNAN